MNAKNFINVIMDYNIDGILLFNLEYPIIDPNFIYVLRPKSGVFEHSALLITENEVTLFTHKLEVPAARELGVNVIEIKSFNDVLRRIKRFARIGINSKILPSYLYERLKFSGIQLVDVSEELEDARMIKTKEEVEFIREAIKISEKALNKVITSLNVRNLHERELAAELEYYMKKYGAMGFAFDTIVAYDENAALPHYKTGSNDKKPENVILIDFGAKYNHYCADITRTFILKRDEEIIKAYNTVLEAQLKAIESIKPGLKAGKVDEIARSIIENKYPGKFIHSLGHMLGVLVHDHSRYKLYKTQTWKLKPGMVFTVEPGVYLEGKFGIRIEDDVLVAEDGVEVLSSFPKELEDITI